MKQQHKTIKSILPKLGKLEFVTGVGGQQLVPAKPQFVEMVVEPFLFKKKQPFIRCNWGEYGFIFYSQN